MVAMLLMMVLAACTDGQKTEMKEGQLLPTFTVMQAVEVVQEDEPEPETEEQATEEKEEPEETEQGIYGCQLYSVYGFPWNTMSQDWSGEQVEGFYYHEISEDCRKEGGEFPVIAQVYTYITCKEYGVDYEMVFALIEHESRCRWRAEGDGGSSIGLMQISERWHSDRMQRLHCTDLMNPFQNIRVGVDFLHELQEQLEGSEFLNADVLAAYNYGMAGARKHLWDKGIHWYSYNEEIMERAQELKAETLEAQERRSKERSGEE